MSDSCPSRRRDPFVYARIEQEGHPILYMPDYVLDWLKPRCHHFVGPRGSGKSSVLYALRWDVAWKSPPIVQIRGSDEIVTQLHRSPKHIGVYYRFEEMDVPYWDSWLRRLGDGELAQRYFGTYLEFTIGYLLVDAIRSIRMHEGGLFLSRSAETSLTSQLLREVYPASKARPRLSEESYAALASLLLDLQSSMRDFVYRQASKAEAKATYPVIGPGDISRAFAKLFRENYPDQHDWTVMVLLDDCNLLAGWQAEVLNAAIAKAQAPLSYKLSSVEGLYPTRAILGANRSLAEHDILNVELLKTSEKASPDSNEDYVTLANCVCKIRLESLYGRSIADAFDLASVLGGFDVDLALEERLRMSQNRRAEEFLRRAACGGKSQITATWLRENNIREETAGPADGAPEAGRERRRNRSRYLNKWSRAAAVALMKQFHLGFPYWGLNVVLHLGYGSIREVLRIMSSMWQAARMPADEFVRQAPLDHETQRQGAKRAAKRFIDNLDDRPLVEGGPSLRGVCNRLGHLFGRLQAREHMLANPEIAALMLRAADLDGDLRSVVEEGLTAGALLLLRKDDAADVSLALHPVMAPGFGISFRSPFYYPRRVTQPQMQAILTGRECDYDQAVSEILRQCAGALSTRRAAPTLFEHSGGASDVD